MKFQLFSTATICNASTPLIYVQIQEMIHTLRTERSPIKQNYKIKESYKYHDSNEVSDVAYKPPSPQTEKPR